MDNGHTMKEAESSKTSKQESSIVSFDFDHLANLATDNPEAFERYREQLYQQAIDRAPIELQRRLKCMQFRINMARQGSSNPIASCLKLSAMMNDSLVELKLALDNPQKYLQEQNSRLAKSAEIIPLFPNR